MNRPSHLSISVSPPSPAKAALPMAQPAQADVRSILAAAALLRELVNCTLETFPAHTIDEQ